MYVIGQVLWAAAEANDPEGGDVVVQSARASAERQDTDHRHWYDDILSTWADKFLGKCSSFASVKVEPHNLIVSVSYSPV